MDRKKFLKGLGLVGMSIPTLHFLDACNTDNSDVETSENIAETDVDISTDCALTNSETQGPFPTKSPGSWQRVDITGDRTGIGLDINLMIENVNTECSPLAKAVVDVWHCDKDGNYSEYGGTGMQSTDYSSNHFLRGRQISDEDGIVRFKSIFPGWYRGRATHIHVHIYNTPGTSLLVTQIAFPEGNDSAVTTVNQASSYGYTKGMSDYTYNSTDNVFSDGIENELCTITGSIGDGYELAHTIKVSA